MKKEYRFLGKTTQFMLVVNVKGTVREIYDHLVEKEILSWDTIEEWIFENKLSQEDNEIRNAYLNNELDYDYPIDELDDKISYAILDLTEDEMMDIISCQTSNMYYQEWYELDCNK